MAQIGAKIRMTGERHRYTVMACNERFALLTKPFNARKTYLYCITDLERKVRGPCNWLFGLPIQEEPDTPEGAAEVMALIEGGHVEVSRRHYKPLDAAEIAQLEARHD